MPATRVNERAAGAALATASVAAMAIALVAGLAVMPARQAAQTIDSFDVAEVPPPPPAPKPTPPPEEVDAPEGEAAPPNIRSEATEVVAPKPRFTPPVPLPAATQAAEGSDTASGAAEVAGPGTGAGGIGNGRGAGGSGDGTGSGRRPDQPPRRTSGAIRNSDFPEAARRAMRGGTVTVDYIVTPQGRATDCRIRRGSGSRLLDAVTCELIVERFRFEPATDENGRPVESVLIEDHIWEVR